MGDAEQRSELPQNLRADSLGQFIDELCDEFESLWKSGERPKIEDFLGRVSGKHRHQLLSHLLATELYWRRRNSETPILEEYHQRFPEDSEAVDCQFPPDGQWPSVADAAAETVFLDTDSPSTEISGELGRFGNYQLLEELGRGGMGVVYRAWQPSADRFVALKLIRRDRFDSLPRERQASVIHRFEHEAQAAGRIEHDHIVTVYEVGEIDGEHFFSMRYVEGQSLIDILKEGPIDGRRAAGYLEPVSRAVHEAHQHGILHRDIKPQNILIDAKTDRALVVDFGLAKLGEGEEMMTEAGDVMGTPPYMSPEQAMDSSQVTAKSDVYALGATLYHAVTGRPPFKATSVLETIRLVADQTPLPPRQIDPQIDRDLETICLKCLEKDPSRRYASAEALADELRRYLHHEPIEARPLGTVGRTFRWCRRYPVVATLLCCTLLFFTAALVASAVGYVQTSAALTKSVQSDRKARQAVNDFFTRVSEESLLNEPGMQPLRKELLEMALHYYEQFVAERSADPTVRDELAMNAYRLGRITEQLGSVEKAEQWYRRALEIQEEMVARQPENTQVREALGDTLNAMGGIFLGRKTYDEAKASYQRAIAEREELVGMDETNSEWQRKLANSYMNLGVVFREEGDQKEAKQRYVEAKNLRYKILKRDSKNEKTRRDLAMGCYNLANLCTSEEPLDEAGALTNLEEALTLFEEILKDQPNDLTNQRRTALTARLYGDLLTHLKRKEEARQPYQRSLTLMRKLAYANPSVPEYSFELAGLLLNYGTLFEDAEGLDHLAEARWYYEQLLDKFPEIPEYKNDLADTLYSIGNLNARLGDQQSALPVVQQALELYEQLVTDRPEDRDILFHGAEAASLCGDLLDHFGRVEESRQPYQRAMELMRRRAELDPDDPLFRFRLAGILVNYGLTLDDTEADANLAEAREILEKLCSDYPEYPQYKRDFAAALCAIGNLKSRMGNPESALQLVQQGRQYLEELCRDYPENGEYQRLLDNVKGREEATKSLQSPVDSSESDDPANKKAP